MKSQWHIPAEGRSRLARDRDIVRELTPKLRYGPVTGIIKLTGVIDIVDEKTEIIRSIGTRIVFPHDYPRLSPSAFVVGDRFTPRSAARHFRADGSCCLWYARSEDGWNRTDPYALAHFLQQLIIFYDRQLTYDATGEFPGPSWGHDRPISELYLQDRLGDNESAIAAFRRFRAGAFGDPDAACHCGSGAPFAQCHLNDFNDLRNRLAGQRFDESDLSILERKEDERSPAATSNCTRRGHFKVYQPERSKVCLRICLGRGWRLPVSGREAVLMKAVALAADLDQMRVVHEPIEECGNCRSVAEELGPVVERAV